MTITRTTRALLIIATIVVLAATSCARGLAITPGYCPMGGYSYAC